jgi:hypothetical protein
VFLLDLLPAGFFSRPVPLRVYFSLKLSLLDFVFSIVLNKSSKEPEPFGNSILFASSNEIKSKP